MTASISASVAGASYRGVGVRQDIVTAVFGAADTEDATQTINYNGFIQKVIFTVPAFTNSITGQLQIKDNQGNTVFDTGEVAKGATYQYNLSEPLYGDISIVIGVSGAAGGSGGSMVAVLRGV